MTDDDRAGAPPNGIPDATPDDEVPAMNASTAPSASGTRRPRRWRLAVPVIAASAGLLFGVSALASHGTDFRSGTTALSDVVERADHRVKTKQEDVADLRSEVVAQQARVAREGKGKDVAKQLTTQADQEADPAGLTELKGNSISVTLTDSKMPASQLPEGGSADWLVVHQQDVQSVVNALWRGGARGMMLMDQRIVSTSAVRCVGNTLILQGRVYSPPFTITAIGDTTKLQAALDDDESVKIYKQYVDRVGLGYSVKTARDTTIPAFTGALQMSHARVVR